MTVTAAPIVHVVDDEPSMRRSLARLLGGAGYQVVPYTSAEEFLATAGPALTGCILLDLRLPGASGLELQAQLAGCGCLAPVIFLTGHGDVPDSVRAMKRGAVDFLQKPVAADDLFAAVSLALAGDAGTRRQAADLEELRSKAAALTDRQRDVWLGVARGRLNKQIAHELGIIERTVKMHRARTMTKLGARSTADLVRMAERLGLVAGPDRFSVTHPPAGAHRGTRRVAPSPPRGESIGPPRCLACPPRRPRAHPGALLAPGRRDLVAACVGDQLSEVLVQVRDGHHPGAADAALASEHLDGRVHLRVGRVGHRLLQEGERLLDLGNDLGRAYASFSRRPRPTCSRCRRCRLPPARSRRARPAGSSCRRPRA